MSDFNYSNGIINVGLDSEYFDSNEERYVITLTSSDKVIGNIMVSYKIVDKFLANIQYELVREARGNGYMIQALELLREPLIEKGLSKPYISVDPENIPSVRTIEKFGGKKIDNDDWFDTYEIDLQEGHRK